MGRQPLDEAGLEKALEKLRVQASVRPNASTPQKPLGARPKIRATVAEHESSDAFAETNPNVTLPADISWIRTTPSPPTDRDRSIDFSGAFSEGFPGYLAESGSSNGLSGRSDQSSHSNNLTASTMDGGVQVSLSYEPLLLQSMAINVDSAFYGPELDPAFRAKSDSGFCAQYTVAVVVDTLQSDLRYILVPLKDGIAIRINVDRDLNLKWFEYCEKTKREDNALKRRDYQTRKLDYRRRVEALKWSVLHEVNAASPAPSSDEEEDCKEAEHGKHWCKFNRSPAKKQ